jgi:hypothetical protein
VIICSLFHVGQTGANHWPSLAFTLTAKYNMVCAKLEDADGHIADLKQQLDNALGAEEMLEQLTERTLSMGEVSACMTTTGDFRGDSRGTAFFRKSRRCGSPSKTLRRSRK